MLNLTFLTDNTPKKLFNCKYINIQRLAFICLIKLFLCSCASINGMTHDSNDYLQQALQPNMEIWFSDQQHRYQKIKSSDYKLDFLQG